jgi:hypothetical protein
MCFAKPPVKSVRLKIVLLAALALSTTSRAEVVYDNTANYLGSYANESREYGDEIVLTGTARTVTDFFFEYFGDFVASADEAGKIRFYKNDDVLNEFQVAPGTLIYESGFFPLNSGYNTRHITGLNVEVPDNFTWTIEFKGISMTLGDEAGLVFYHPIVRGSSFDDYWAKQPNGRFALFGYPDLKNNFAALVIAVPEPSTLAITGIALGLLGFLRFRRGR